MGLTMQTVHSEDNTYGVIVWAETQIRGEKVPIMIGATFGHKTLTAARKFAKRLWGV